MLSVSVLPTARPSPVARDAVTVPVQVQVGSASGSVIDSNGKGIAGARVVLTPAPTATPALAGVHGRRPKLHQLVAVTGEDGTFTFPKVRVGSYTATASKEGFEPSTSAAFTVQQGANTAIPPITLKATPAPVVGSVTGSVTDSSGAPVAGAVVVIFPASPNKTRATPQRRGLQPPGPAPVQVTTTDKDGHYTFDQVRAGTYEVAVSAKGFQKATSASFTVAQGSNTAPTVALTPVPQPVVGNVSGTVTDSDGKPLAGAIVELSASPSTAGGSGGSSTSTTIVRPPLPIRIAITDTNGQYKFENVPTGAYTVSARAKGFEPATSAPFTVAKGDNTAPPLKLSAAPAPVVGNVSGLVTDASGKPIAGALVVLSHNFPIGMESATGPGVILPLPGPVQVAKTDSNGKYTFSNVPAGTYTVSAAADGFQRATSAPFTVAAGDNSAPTLALTAIPAPVVGTVTGTVTDSSGKPISGAEVILAPAPANSGGGTSMGDLFFRPPGVFAAKTDANGQYTIDRVPAGTYVVLAAAEGFQRSTSAPFTVKEGTNTAPTLALTPVPAPVLGTVTGTVTDSAGKALAGALVELSAVPPMPTGPGDGGTMIIGKPFPIRVAITGDKGQYTFNEVPAGSYTVSASARGYQSATSAPFTVAMGTNTAPTLALTALPAPVFGSVAGSVTDAKGNPIAAALVELVAVSGKQDGTGTTGDPILFPPPQPVLFPKTDANGHYSLDQVPAGTYVVKAWAPGFQPATSASFTVAAGDNTAPTVALMPGDGFPPPLVL